MFAIVNAAMIHTIVFFDMRRCYPMGAGGERTSRPHSRRRAPTESAARTVRTRRPHFFFMRMTFMRLLISLFFALHLSAADIAAILRDRVEVRKAAPAIVVAVVTPEGSTFYHHGPATEDSLFRVASATKVFTGLLLAGMVERGEMALDDPVAKYLPDGVVIPAGRRAIT